jgi:hypothetical protein
VRCLFPRVRVSLAATASARRWRLRLTTRAPQPGVVGKAATLFVDGHAIATWRLTATWSTTETTCDLRGTRSDELTIVWPDPGEDRDERIRKVARAMSDGVLARRPIVDVYTVWGEIQSFKASALVESAPAYRAVAYDVITRS